ncbi:MAG: formate dehydrogenase major subunit [Acidimicrobiaceae bacterium]|nr:formate dehydrogenase major subunit [Acidimicrobiaceae bacterium]
MVKKLLASFPAWPALRQLTTDDRSGHRHAAMSTATAALHPRTIDADSVVSSICPYCAVGCGQRVYVQDGRITQIEGDPDSPVSRGRLCPKGAATKSLVTGPGREKKVKYRPPYATEWQDLDLDEAMDRIAERVIATRNETWDPVHKRTLGFASLGGATLDNEENYLMKKLYTALGAIQIENQARI